MATQYLQFGYTSGQSLVVKLITLGGEAVLFTSATAVESPSSSGIYKAAFTEIAAINATLRAFVTLSGTGVASYEVKFTGTDAEVVQASEFVNVDIPTGGDATAAKQNEILGKLAAPAVVYTNPSSPNKLTIIRGDAYDDDTENNGKLTWATGKTLTGATVRFTIRDASDNILIDQTTAGVSTAVNSQTAEVSLTSAATALLTVATTNKFDAEAYWAADNRWTFARGQCTVLEDQTRT